MNIAETMEKMGQNARASARILATADDVAKSNAIRSAAAAIISQSEQILIANQKDLEEATIANRPSALIDRLQLDKNADREDCHWLEHHRRFTQSCGGSNFYFKASQRTSN